MVRSIKNLGLGDYLPTVRAAYIRDYPLIIRSRATTIIRASSLPRLR